MVSVVAVLASLLLPSLGGARAAGQQAVCASNQRQLVIAIGLYADDSRDRLPPGAADFLANLNRWHGTRPSASAPFAPAGGAITPYLDGLDTGNTASVRWCPAFAPTLRLLADGGLGYERGCGGYGYNNAYLGVERRRIGGGAGMSTVVTDRVGAARAGLPAPSRTLAFGDAAMAASGRSDVIEYSFIEPRQWPESPAGGAAGGRPDPSIHFRHSRRAVLAWLDGHVNDGAMTRSRPTAFEGLDSAARGLGWTGDRDDNSLFAGE